MIVPAKKQLEKNYSYLANNPDWLDFVKRLSDSTSDALVENWIKNAERNKKKYGFDDRWGDVWLGRGENKVAIIVGASPALEGNVDELRGLDNRYIVIAVSSALHFLQQHDIRPSFVMHADGLDRTAKYLDDVDSRDLTLVANCFSSPAFLDKWQGDVFFLPISIGATHNKAYKRYARITGRGYKPPQCFPALGNQYNFGVIFARIILCTRAIIFCGVEYSYTDKYYAGKDDPKDKWPKAIGPIPDIFNEPRWTVPPLYQAKLALEEMTGRMRNDVFINATEAGILGVSGRHGYLPWIKQMTLKQAVYVCGKAVDMAETMRREGRTKQDVRFQRFVLNPAQVKPG